MPKRTPVLPDLAVNAEFDGAQLPDARLNARLAKLVAAASLDPAASLPKMMGSEAEREAAYRFLSNERVEFDAVLGPHIEQSVARAAASGVVLAIHDTSTFKFAGSRGNELGYINTGARGFFVHATIAVENNESRNCLGLLKASTLFRDAPPRKDGSKRQRNGAECAKVENRESERWWEHVSATQGALVAKQCEVIHVADSEADNYTLLSKMVGENCRFVTRMARDRRARPGDDGPWSLVSEATDAAEFVAEREVPLSARGTTRPPRTLKKYPPRDARHAKLRFSAMLLQLKRPPYLHAPYPASLDINVVRVHEVDAPEGTEAVEWFLFTTENVGTREEVLAVVDIYRRRWVVEEYFRAVKTGCMYEQRQLEGKHAWMIGLAITLPLAWRLLQLRNVARSDAARPATEVLTNTEVEVLRHLRPKRLSEPPTIRESMLAIAEMGGHVKNNGEPGWLVLHRGLSKLQALAEGVELGREIATGRRDERPEM